MGGRTWHSHTMTSALQRRCSRSWSRGFAESANHSPCAWCRYYPDTVQMHRVPNREETPSYHESSAAEDITQHTLRECPGTLCIRSAILSSPSSLAGILGVDLSFPCVVRSMLGSNRVWAVMARRRLRSENAKTVLRPRSLGGDQVRGGDSIGVSWYLPKIWGSGIRTGT